MNASKVKFGINYIDTKSPLHALNGITKFALFLAWVTVVLTTFDLRLITLLIVTGLYLLKLTNVPLRVYKPLLLGTASVLSLNALFMYLLAPQQGTELIGSETILLTLPGNYSLSQETLFYLVTVTLKYMSMFPIALIFVFTTHPTEFAASLNRIGVPYKIAYAVSLTLRYLPEVKKDFINIMHAQQARGVELSKKAPLITRIKNVAKGLRPAHFFQFGSCRRDLKCDDTARLWSTQSANVVQLCIFKTCRLYVLNGHHLDSNIGYCKTNS